MSGWTYPSGLELGDAEDAAALDPDGAADCEVDGGPDDAAAPDAEMAPDPDGAADPDGSGFQMVEHAYVLAVAPRNTNPATSAIAAIPASVTIGCR